MSRGRRRRAAAALLAVVFEDQFAAISVDGVVRWERVHRTEVPREVSLLLIELARPALVRITEADGSVFADVLTPPVRNPEGVLDAIRLETVRAAIRPELVEVVADGFIAGEDVEVAPVLQAVSARQDGSARALLDSSELGASRLVVLAGSTSGTVVIATPG